jgi:SAM-dependent methyltransferase
MEERARQRALVRRGYDAISLAYRGDDGPASAASAEDASRYAGWAAELAGLLPAGARVLDLGCGAGVPATKQLTDLGLQVIGVDFSGVQLARARRLVPAARLIQADMAALQFAPASLDAVVSFYALIHLPLADQRPLFARIRSWLRPGGLLLAITGAQAWTGTDYFHGADIILGARRHGKLPGMAGRGGPDAAVAPVHPGRRQRPQPHPGQVGVA